MNAHCSILHLLDAAVWIGGLVVLLSAILSAPRRASGVAPALEFERAVFPALTIRSLRSFVNCARIVTVLSILVLGLAIGVRTGGLV